MKAAGTNGQLALDEDRIRIHRDGLRSPTIQGLMGKYIPLSQISSIRFRKAGLLRPGYIHFVLTGKEESRGNLLTKPDENTVTFGFLENKPFIQIKKAIEKAIIINAKLESLKPSERAELEKLSGLKDQGVITEEDFSRKKQKILGI